MRLDLGSYLFEREEKHSRSAYPGQDRTCSPAICYSILTCVHRSGFLPSLRSISLNASPILRKFNIQIDVQMSILNFVAPTEITSYCVRPPFFSSFSPNLSASVP